MSFTDSCRRKAYGSAIGPDNPQEAKMIHKGIYDSAAIWKPQSFAAKIIEVTEENDFEEFEDKELQYYLGFFVGFYVLKWSGVVLAISFMPELVSFFK